MSALLHTKKEEKKYSLSYFSICLQNLQFYLANYGLFSLPIGRRSERMYTNKLADHFLIEYQ